VFRLLSCIELTHSWPHLGLAMTICVLGSLLTMRLFSRTYASRGLQKANWTLLAGFVGGSTVWTTHFLAMLGIKTDILSGYDPKLTLLSMAISVAGASVGFAIASISERGALVEAGGATIGLSTALMHYTGVAGYDLAAQRQYDLPYVLASIACAAVFGAMATNRIAKPASRFCLYGGALGLVLAIASTHFLGMAGLTLTPDAAITVSDGLLSTEAMGLLIVAVMSIILALGTSTYIIDIQSSQVSVERYRHLAMTDQLTGRANRAAFQEYLMGAIETVRERRSCLSVLSFDLNRFKEINDLHGHAAGDSVLQTIGARLNLLVRANVFVARVGGDEFALVLTNYTDQSEVEALASTVIGLVKQPVEWNDHRLAVGSSVGVSTYPTLATNLDDLLSQADIAMYRAKATATNSVCVYEPAMDQVSRDRRGLASDMRDGLDRGEFQLFYQKQNDTTSREVVAFEVLLRWSHPVRGFIPPSEFIPIAEKTGFIVDLGQWVLRTACVEAATWKKPLRIAVNVAARQLLEGKIPDIVQDILEETGLPAARLEIEITESGLIEDHVNVLQTIRRLRALGVKIAMDDYGTGYSSLSTLQTFPFDKIKIDRAFIDRLTSNNLSVAIVRSTLILAASLEIPVLAEGVETEEQFEFLRREGCQQVQGYLFGKPTPRRDIENIVNPRSMPTKETWGRVVGL